VAWNIANSPLRQLRVRYDKPDLLYQQEAYGQWLQDLISDIKEVDPGRPVSVDIDLDDYINEDVDLLERYVSNVDAVGLVAAGDYEIDDVPFRDIEIPYFYSDMEVSRFFAAADTAVGFLAASWQDENTPGFITVDGLLDDRGSEKAEMYQLANRWTGIPAPDPLPALKILRPAQTINIGEAASYHLLV